ncbi:MAG: outer membrane protein assembly factor BamA, partial [Muribaculaceae bacterium]|nr:outer membrane protein assembly factor BamA [Muribaculaceae bacterium]
MRYITTRLITILTLLASAFLASAQERTDTIYNPPVVYTALPSSYEIAGLSVSGADNYEDYIVLGYSGLKLGDRIEIPGNDITTAVKRLMRQGLFAQAQVLVEKIAGDKVWLRLNLRTQPRISEVKYTGMKKGEREDLQKRLQLMKGNQITQNIVNRATDITKKYFSDKGFGNATVKITLDEDLSNKNEMIVTIDVDKHSKVKVHKIYLSGNEVLSDFKLKRVITKTNEGSNIHKLFSQKKFVQEVYEADLDRIIEK